MRLFLIFFFFISCEQRSFDFSYVEKRWLAVKKVSYTNQKIIPRVQITKPKNAWQHLATLDIETKLGVERDCLFYKYQSSKKGVFQIITKNPQKSCMESLYQKSYFKLEDLRSFWISVKEDELDLGVSKIKYTFKFPSLAHDDVGFLALSHGKYEEKLKIGDQCFSVNDRCEVLQDNCHLCPDGNFQVVDNNCEGRGSRFCGHQVCGKSAEIACPRGRRYNDYKQDYCVSESPMGWCEADSRVKCLDGVLICE
jgi:hypothetical protein